MTYDGLITALSTRSRRHAGQTRAAQWTLEWQRRTTTLKRKVTKKGNFLRSSVNRTQICSTNPTHQHIVHMYAQHSSQFQCIRDHKNGPHTSNADGFQPERLNSDELQETFFRTEILNHTVARRFRKVVARRGLGRLLLVAAETIFLHLFAAQLTLKTTVTSPSSTPPPSDAIACSVAKLDRQRSSTCLVVSHEGQQIGILITSGCEPRLDHVAGAFHHRTCPPSPNSKGPPDSLEPEPRHQCFLVENQHPGCILSAIQSRGRGGRC